MNYIVGAAIGILAWQIISFIIYEISKENEDVLELCTLGLVAFPLGFANWIYRVIRFKWCKMYLNGYRFFINETGSCVYYMTDKQAKKLYSKGENDHYIVKCSEGRNWKSPPHKSEIYRGQEVFHGIDMEKYWKERSV